jgi:hypothetical protein
MVFVWWCCVFGCVQCVYIVHVVVVKLINERNNMTSFIIDWWNLIMDHERNPLSNIKDLRVRHLVMQILAWMWCIVFTAMTGTWMYLGVNILFHALLLCGIFITVSVFEAAKRKPQIFYTLRGKGGEHE